MSCNECIDFCKHYGFSNSTTDYLSNTNARQRTFSINDYKILRKLIEILEIKDKALKSKFMARKNKNLSWPKIQDVGYFC